MAGEWIKMRTNLWNDPRVSKLCDITDQPEAAIVGGLYWLWATADEHTESGILPGLTTRAIDRKTGVQGLGQGLVDIGWLADHPEGVRIVGFEEHNGTSAKKRCQTAKRVEKHKSGNAQVTQQALPESKDGVSDALPREEKRREDQHNSKGASGPDESQGPGPEPDPLAPSEMYLSWKPDPVQLKAYAFASAIGLDAFTDEAIGVFTCHYTPSRRIETHATWVSLLVKWVKRDRTYTAKGNVRPLPNKQSAAPDYHSNNTDWADDLGVL